MHKILILLAVFLFANTAHAATSEWAITDNARVRLISQTEAVGDGSQITLGLHFKLDPHWKIYWRSAGDAGYPPSLEWAGSNNVKDATIRWPLPERFSILGFETLGYKNEAVLPVTLTLNRPGEAVNLTAQISYLACAEVCVPHDAELSLSLPQGAGTPAPEAQLINRFEVRVPKPGPTVGLTLKDLQFKPDASNADTGTLYVTATSSPPFTSPDIFIEGPDILAFAAPDVSMNADATVALLKVRVEGLSLLKKPLLDASLTLTLADGSRGAEFGDMQPTPLSAGTRALADTLSNTHAPRGPPLWAMLALAVLGGLILNLMPCVLPVLSIKLLGVVGHGGGKARTVRLSFLASSAGIISTFLLLATVLIVLKSTGLAIGWGIQFQHPWFLVAMTLMVTLFACNLWGFFEVHLPDAVTEFGAQETHVPGLGGHFMTGALATLLATPCSAPFLGTAVGFALARGPVQILAIFTALGLGLAMPYLLVAAYPKFATMMPKPGRWMVTMRRVLGFFLAATGVWLVSVLAVQVSTIAALLIAAVMIAVTAMLYLHKRLRRRYGRLDWIVVAVLAGVAFAVPGTLREIGARTSNTAKLEGLWQPFDERELARRVTDGQMVFVDVTAKWCITCQVNKALVLSKGQVYARLSSPDVYPMKADWTRPDDAITRYLSSFGRYGIPFNAVYGPGAPKGIVLPELLTSQAVLDALDQAARTHP